MKCGVDVLIVIYDKKTGMLTSYKSRESAKFLNLKGKKEEEKFSDLDVRGREGNGYL